MSLLNLKTDLKSLKYGQDQPGGGNSRQPYITTDINTVDTDFNKLRLTKFDDGFIRGGVIGSLNSSIVDTLRIGKFFLDFPKGPLFITKQVGLQLSGPRLESKQLSTNNPTSGQGILNNVGNLITNVANKIVNAVGPTRIYNLGINTLTQVPLNAFGGHVVRHGLLPVQNEDTKYINVVQNNNQNGTNRLLRLSTKFKLGDGKLNDSIDKGLIGSINQGISNLLASRGLPAGPASFLSINKDDATIDDYIGGSSSVYGIGSTLIRRYSNTEDIARIDPLITYSNIFAGVTRNDKGEQEKIKIKNTRDFLLSTPFYQKSDLNSKGWKYDDGTSLDDSFLNKVAKESDRTNLYKLNSSINYNNDLGTGPKSISSYTGITNTPTAVAQNTVVYVDPLIKKYSELVSQVNNQNSAVSIYTHPDYDQDPLTGNISSLDSGLTYYTNTSDTHYSIKSNNNDGNGNVKSALESIVDKTKQSKVYKQQQISIPSNGVSVNIKNNTVDRQPKDTLLNGKNNITAVPSKFIYNTSAKGLYNRNNDKKVDNDTLAVVFTPIHPFTGNEYPTKFLAYLTNYSENYDSGWNDIRYAGRAESFYIFNSFKRTVQLGLNIPCFNKEDLINNHKKLFALGDKGLAYALAGQYSNENLMGGIIIKLTVGNYLINTPGIVTSMNMEILNESPWDIDNRYAHYIKVSFNFTVIGDALPQYMNLDPVTDTPVPQPSPQPQPQPAPQPVLSPNPTPITLPPFPDSPPLAIDHTYVKKPPVYNFNKPSRPSQFRGFENGNFGGGGAGSDF